MSSEIRVACTINGIAMRLNPEEAIQSVMMAGLYEPEQSDWVNTRLGPGAVFVDIGANFGWFTTLAYSKVGNSGHIFGFEPSALAHGVVQEAFPTASYPNVMLVNAAVGREPGELTIYLPTGGGVHSPSAFVSPGEFRPQIVPKVALDRFEPLASVPVIDLVKMDVEGSEPDVVEGMVELIRAGRIRRVMCEFNTWWLKANNTDAVTLAARFKELGFEIETATEWQSGPASGGGTFSVQDVLFKYTG